MAGTLSQANTAKRLLRRWRWWCAGTHCLLIAMAEALTIFVKRRWRNRGVPETRMPREVWRLAGAHVMLRGCETIVEALLRNLRICRRRRGWRGIVGGRRRMRATCREKGD